MLRGKIIAEALNTGESISTDRSRCLRMRLNRNPCAGCMEQCRFNAITIVEDVQIAANRCTECMLCVSSCPSGCFEIRGLDFYSLIEKLSAMPSSVGPPVLGCRANFKTPSHEKTFCFGFLSEEHIIALSVLMKSPLQIDLSECADCRNSFIVAILEKRIRDVEEKTVPGAVDKVRLIKNKKDLDFQEVSYGRRGFLKALTDFTRKQAADLFNNENQGEVRRAYSAKALPFKRELLNRVLEISPEETRKVLLKNHYYTVDAIDTCNNCFACIGMCPTGALKIENIGDDRDLFFSAALCNGCGLCESFCMSGSVAVKKGFTGDNPFEFIRAKKSDGGNLQYYPIPPLITTVKIKILVHPVDAYFREKEEIKSPIATNFIVRLMPILLAILRLHFIMSHRAQPIVEGPVTNRKNMVSFIKERGEGS